VNQRHLGGKASEISHRVIGWGRNNFQRYPWRSTDNHWLALVAEIMLQRTRAAAVIPVWNYWEQSFSTPQVLMASPHQSIRESFKSLGLGWRVDFLIKLAEKLGAREIPENKADLMKLPGVGDYVSSAYLSLHAEVRESIVDSNVVRWISRLTGIKVDGETRRSKWIRELADEMTPVTGYREYNYGVLDLTMTVCKARPLCARCPVAEYCASRQQFYDV